MPIFWRCLSMSVLGSVISTPSKKIFPEVGSSRRFKHRRNVLLPEPEGPMTHTTSPLWISTVISFKTSSFSKLFPRCCTWISASFPLVVTAPQPPLQPLYKVSKNHHHHQVDHCRRHKGHKRAVCTASDNIRAFSQILDGDISGHRRLL